MPKGLFGLAGGDISEEEQDVYRNLDFRVLPDYTQPAYSKYCLPSQITEGQEHPGLPHKINHHQGVTPQ